MTSGGRQPKDQPVSDTRKAEMGELLQSEEMGNHMEGEGLDVFMSHKCGLGLLSRT